MRAAVAQALHHTAHRAAFGKLLADQPLMQNVLADLCLDSEAATVTAMRLARAYDERRPVTVQPPGHRGVQVLDLQVARRGRSARRSSASAATATSRSRACRACTARRRCNSIWEGSGNVNSLDVLRAMAKTPESLDAFWAEVDLAAGADARLDAWVADTKAAFSDFETIEFRARRVVERMGLALQGSLLVRNSPP